MDPPTDATVLLQRLGDGDPLAAEELLPLIYGELHGVARSLMSRERPDHTLQPTLLVNEAYLRLIDQTRARWQNREQFLAVAAKAMRRLLVNHARDRRAQKRSGERQREPLDHVLDSYQEGDVDLVALDAALERLSSTNEELGRIVELRFFGGLGTDEIARVLDSSPRTVDRRWTAARSWLYRELGGAVG